MKTVYVSSFAVAWVDIQIRTVERNSTHSLIQDIRIGCIKWFLFDFY